MGLRVGGDEQPGTDDTDLSQGCCLPLPATLGSSTLSATLHQPSLSDLNSSPHRWGLSRTVFSLSVV